MMGCSDSGEVSKDRHYTGSTPCETYTKSILGIPLSDSVDFIIWDLDLKSNRDFVFKANYGIGKPNTSGFYNEGKTLSVEGKYDVSNVSGQKPLYILHSPQMKSTIKLRQIQEDIFHFTDDKEKLLVGNGGWSYVLNLTKSPL